MAMEGTHIRFALDLKEKLGVVNEKSYIIGAVYPDSRYVTKIGRSLTHLKDYRDNLLSKDDFHKGWFTHLLCDDIQYWVIQEVFPEVGTSIPRQNSNEWIKRTSIKLLQDLDDITKFKIKAVLNSLENTENPNGEDKEILEKYNNLLKELYDNPEEITLDSYKILWKEFGLDEELCQKLMEQANKNNNDLDFITKVRTIYQKTLDRAIENLG